MQDTVGGRYRLDEQIGSGGMAEVWRATDLRTGTTVALKRLHPRLAHDPASRARFVREVDAARAVDHAAAIGVLDAGDGPDGAWLVMELLAGGSLADRLRAGPMPVDTVAAIGADVAAALAAVHAAGLVHRDVKPSNILLDGDGGARLGDFGIARGEASPAQEDVTATGDVVGTLRFLPPEVLAGQSATPASDVWALGAVLYEAVAGRPPFDASSPAALVASQRSIPARPTSDASVSAIVLAMLDVDPTARPAAAEVSRSLAGRTTATDPSEDATVVLPAPVRPAPARATAPAEGERATPVPAAAPIGRQRRRVPIALLIAAMLAAGLVLAVGNPFGAGVVQPSPPAAGADAAATPGLPSREPANPSPTPVAGAGGAGGAPTVNGGKGKGKDKPAKPGKGKGGG